MIKKKNYELAWEDYKTGNFTYEDIAKKYKVTKACVQSWRNRHWAKWEKNNIQKTVDDMQNVHSDSSNIQETMQTDMQEEAVKLDVTKPKETLQAIARKQVEDTKPESLVACDVDYWSKLEERHRRFVVEYLIDCNATQAAIRCGYPPSNASVIGSQLRNSANIASCIARAEAERSRRTGLNVDLIDRELARILRVNPNDVVDLDTGKIKEDATDDDLAAIQSVKVKPVIDKFGEVHYEREVRFVPKDRAMELAMKRHAMLIERKQVDMHQTIEHMSTEEREKRINDLLKKRQNTIDIEPA